MSKKTSSATAWLRNRQDRPCISTDPLAHDAKGKLEYEVLSDKQIVLNMERAAAYIELPIFRGEREVKESHVQRLYDEMAHGRFNPALVTMATAELHGTVYKLNGQHTAWAKAYCEDYEPTVREIRFKVKDEEQLRQLYSTFDRHFGRTDAHITSIEMANDPVFKNYPVRVLTFVSRGLRFWLWPATNDRSRSRPQDLAQAMTVKYQHLCKTMCDFAHEHIENAKEARFVRRIAVCAAMLETFNKVPTIAPQFWIPVCTGLGLEAKTDPRHQLRVFLQTARLNTSSSRGVRSVSDEELYNHCVPAFNKWRRGEPVTSLRPTRERIRAI